MPPPRGRPLSVNLRGQAAGLGRWVSGFGLGAAVSGAIWCRIGGRDLTHPSPSAAMSGVGFGSRSGWLGIDRGGWVPRGPSPSARGVGESGDAPGPGAPSFVSPLGSSDVLPLGYHAEQIPSKQRRERRRLAREARRKNVKKLSVPLHCIACLCSDGSPDAPCLVS